MKYKVLNKKDKYYLLAGDKVNGIELIYIRRFAYTSKKEILNIRDKIFRSRPTLEDLSESKHWDKFSFNTHSALFDTLNGCKPVYVKEHYRAFPKKKSIFTV